MTTKRTQYQDRIDTDSAILGGKATIRGTHISVDLVLDRLSQNPDLADLFAAYPELTRDDVKAALAYARAVLADTRTGDAARDRRLRRMLSVATHSEVDGDALLEELEREDAAPHRRTAHWAAAGGDSACDR